MKANKNLKSAVSAVALTACVFAGIGSASLIATTSAALMCVAISALKQAQSVTI
jgi:hypothetical protein